MWKSRRDGTTSTLARPRRGQTTVTAGLDLRIATTSSHSHDPNGVARQGKGKSFYVRPLRGREHRWGLDHPQVKTCGYANATSPRSVGNETRCGSALTRPAGALHGATAPFNAPQGPYTLRQLPYTPEGPYTCRRHLQRRGSALPRRVKLS